MAISADDVIKALSLMPHPEGGHYVETFRDAKTHDGRSVGTAIYYLLKDGEQSDWHRIDATEVWHFYGGAPLELLIGSPSAKVLLGPDLMAGERPQAVVPAQEWQAARSTGKWSLVGCTVSPGFDFRGFEIAKPGWTPKG